MHDLIKDIFVEAFSNPYLNGLEDQAQNTLKGLYRPWVIDWPSPPTAMW